MSKASITTEHRGLVVVKGVEVRFYCCGTNSNVPMLKAVAANARDWVIIPYPVGLPEPTAYLVAVRTLQAQVAAIQAAAAQPS